MSDLVEDVRRAPTPQSLASRGPLVNLVKDAQASLLRIAVVRRTPEGTNGLATELRRYALWLDQALLAEDYSDDAMLELASSLYEFSAELSDFSPSSIFRPPLNDLIRSAILASLTPFQGRASIVAGRVADSMENIKIDTAVESCHLRASQVVVALLARRFRDSIVKGIRLREAADAAISELRAREAGDEEYVGLDWALRLANAASRTASGMLTGEFVGLLSALDDLIATRNAAADVNDSNWFWLADRLSTCW